MGGFHLSGAFYEPIVGQTVAALAAFEPKVIVPAHCTGYKAQMAIARRLPEAYVHNAVGTTYLL
jgi:7,8-dihydropterin-6-yl-methyl-4-(beta-D-ribofuranosyl)aminobenzene 5'-phosphate synthase